MMFPQNLQITNRNRNNFQNMEVLIFRTDIKSDENLKDITEQLNSLRGIHKWTVDLDAWEKILRVEAKGITANEIEDAVKKKNYFCEELKD